MGVALTYGDLAHLQALRVLAVHTSNTREFNTEEDDMLQSANLMADTSG